MTWYDSRMDLRLVYVTAKDREEAQRIGKVLIEERLSACVTILSPAESMYFWEGKLCHATEAVLLAKTKASLVPKFLKRVQALHSYKCPCILSLPILEGNPDYLAWVEESLRARFPETSST